MADVSGKVVGRRGERRGALQQPTEPGGGGVVPAQGGAAPARRRLGGLYPSAQTGSEVVGVGLRVSGEVVDGGGGGESVLRQHGLHDHPRPHGDAQQPPAPGPPPGGSAPTALRDSALV